MYKKAPKPKILRPFCFRICILSKHQGRWPTLHIPTNLSLELSQMRYRSLQNFPPRQGPNMDLGRQIEAAMRYIDQELLGEA